MLPRPRSDGRGRGGTIEAMDQKLAMLSKVPLFAGLSSHDLTELGRLVDEVGYGRTATYSRLAELVGNARAVRAVGSACATNPLPVVVPCHRVVRSDGGMGGYLGGLQAKRLLLDLERAA